MPIPSLGVSEMFRRFGESIQVIEPGQDPRDVVAIVNREPPESIDPIKGTFAPKAHIAFRNDAELGISTAQLDPRTWKVKYAVRVGQAPTEHPFSRIVTQDESAVELEVR